MFSTARTCKALLPSRDSVRRRLRTTYLFCSEPLWDTSLLYRASDCVCVCVRLHSVHSGSLGVHTQFFAGVGARHRLRVVRCASVLRGQTTPLFRKRAAWDEHLHTIA